MERIAFKMKLFPGQEAEYLKRHDEIWPELVLLLKETGIQDYSIFLDKETLSLFGAGTTRSLIPRAASSSGFINWLLEVLLL